MPDKALTLDYLREEWQAMREAQSELEVSLQRYADLYDLAPVGYLSLTRSGCIREINLTGARMLGLTRGQLIGGHLLTLIAVPDRRKYLSHLTRLRRGQPQSSTEVEIVNPSGRVGVMQLISAISHSNETGAKLFHTAMVDITERRQAEEDLRQARDELEIRVRERTADLTLANEALNAAVGAHRKAEAALRVSQARLQAILDHSSSLIFLKNVQGRYLLVNRRFEQVFHYSSAQVVGKTDADIFPPEQAAAYRANDLKALQAGVAMQFDEVSMHDDGPHVSIVSKFPLRDTTGRIHAIGGIVTDITERKRLEAEVLSISEREQRRIAQDLHDGLGQQLAGIACLANVLKRNLADQSSTEAQTAARISALLAAAQAQTQSLAQGLYPVSKDPEGLMRALDQLAANVSGLFKVSCEFSCDAPLMFADGEAATHLYRIAQEAVSNSLKHGRATKIQIELRAAPGQIVLMERDNGKGLKRSASRRKGMGLEIMSHRAAMLGGEAAVRNKEGGGVEMICTVPYGGGRPGPQSAPPHQKKAIQHLTSGRSES